MKISVRVSTRNDVYGIREVQKKTWFNTYPNEKENITISDIESVFKNDGTEEGKKKIEERKKRYENKNFKAWVVIDNKGIIGFCTTEKEEKINRLNAIYVLPEYQGKGIGGLLIKKAFRWLGEKKDIKVNVVSYNKNAIGFYKKFGFEETGKSGVFDSAAKLPSGKFMPELELIKKAKNLDKYKEFLDHLIKKIKDKGIDVSDYELDHIGYQTSSNEDYDTLKPKFSKIGKLLKEDIVGGRRVGIFKCKTPLKYKNYQIPAIELIAPKEEQVCPSALEHAEFVIDQPYELFMKRYPNLNWNTTAINQDTYSMIKLKLEKFIQVKFHQMPILEIVKLKN